MTKAGKHFSLHEETDKIMAILEAENGGQSRTGAADMSRPAKGGRGVGRWLADALGIPPELAAPAGGRGYAAMMALQHARDAGGGSVRQQHLEEAQRHIAKLNPARHGELLQHLQGCVVALGGRGGDTHIAHVTPGEWVIPERILDSELRARLLAAAQANGIDPSRILVGSGRNSINPNTGQMEFLDYGGQNIEEITATTPRGQGLLELPRNPSNSGYQNYGRPDAQFGLPASLEATGEAGYRWNATGAPPFGVGNMSLSDGSVYDPHLRAGDHTKGTGIDIGPVRNDGKQVGITSWEKDPAYDRKATQSLVDTWRSTGAVKDIFSMIRT